MRRLFVLLPLGLLFALAATACTGDGSGSASSSGGSAGSTGTSGSSGTSSGSTGGSSGSSSGTGSASFSGPLAFPARGALGNLSDLADGGVRDVVVVSLDGDDQCGRTGNPPAPYTGFKLEVSTLDGTPLLPGTYVAGVGATTIVSGNIFSSEPGGVHVGHNYIFTIESGTATLSAFDDTHVAGSMDLQLHLPDGGTTPFSGTFDALTCP